LEPNHAALAGYVVWYMDRRDAAILAMTTGLNPYATTAFQGRWGFTSIPWPWQLADAYTIDSFLLWLIDTNNLPVSTPMPTAEAQTSTSSDCTAIAYWLGQTTTRTTEASKLKPQGILPPGPSLGDPPVYFQYADALLALAEEQEMSNPPDEARAANALLVSAWTKFAEAFYALDDANESGSQAEWDAAFAIMGNAFADDSAAWDEILELKAMCGLP
jgi:hypothetical protein